eukprot:scaffold4649_cov72-Cyclotella_meneghiniana.AAC.23
MRGESRPLSDTTLDHTPQEKLTAMECLRSVAVNYSLPDDQRKSVLNQFVPQFLQRPWQQQQ